MTVQSTVPFRKDYEANGTTNVFAYPFQIYDAADLTVYLNGTVKTLNTDYTVSDVGNANGGNITFTMTDSNDDPVNIADGDDISIVMDMDLDRTTNYQPSGAFLAADVNDDFDRLWLATNQQAQEIDRSLRLKADDITTSNMEIPAKDDRKGKLLGFNATTGDPEVSDNNKDNWNAAYNDKINSASFSSSTLTLTQQDGGTVTASHTPYLPIAGGSVTGDIDFGSGKAIFGSNDDLQIYNFLGASIIKEAGSGNLELRATDLVLKDDSGGKYAQFTEDGDAKLFYDNDEKLATTSSGIDVTGTLTADGLTVDTDTLHVDATNNRVGVGTTSPVRALDVRGGTTDVVANFESSDTGGYISLQDNTTSSDTAVLVGAIGDELRIDTGDTESVRITSAGRVGIGTNNPDKLLHIHGDDAPASLRLERSTTELGAGAPIGIIEFESNDASTGSSGVVGKIDVRAEDSSPDSRMAFYTHDNDSGTGTLTEQVRITSNGYVGIKKGGTNPTTELDVNGTVTATGLTVDTDTLYIDATNDRVGIGTTSPVAPLQVNGTIYAEGGSFDAPDDGQDPSGSEVSNNVAFVMPRGNKIAFYDDGYVRRLLEVDSSNVIQFGQTNTNYVQGINLNCGTGGDVTIQNSSGDAGLTVEGALTAGGNTYPTTQGTDGQVLVTDGNGTLSFADQSGGGGSGDVVDDTTPQLGGDLDTNDKAILLGDANLAETQNIIKFGAGNDMRIFSDGNQGRIEGQMHFNGNVSGSVVGKLASMTLGDTPEERWLRFILVKASSGASKYYHFRVKGYVNSEAIESHVDYDVYLHVRDDGDSTNAYDLDVTGYEVGIKSLQIGMKILSYQNEFYVKVPEDYSAVEVYNLADDTSEDLKDLISTTTSTDPTGITYATPKIRAFNNDTIAFSDGSNAAPSITFDGDSNTGIRHPAADTISFVEGGAERARLNSAGQFLVGTTSGGSVGAKIKANGRIEASTFYTTNNGSLFKFGGYFGGPCIYLDSYYTNSQSTFTGKLLAFRSATATEKASLSLRGDDLLLRLNSGNLMVGTDTTDYPTAKLDVNGDTIRLRSDRTPASSSASGNKGDICYDSNYIYVCVATNTWKRTAIDTW